MIKLLIFDFDGTLADSLPGIHAAINLMARGMGYPERSVDEVRHAIGNGAKKLVSRLIPEEARENDETFKEAFECYQRIYDASCVDNTVLFEGITDRHACRRMAPLPVSGMHAFVSSCTVPLDRGSSSEP